MARAEDRWAGQNRREQNGVSRVALESAMVPRQIGVSLYKGRKKFGLENPKVSCVVDFKGITASFWPARRDFVRAFGWLEFSNDFLTPDAG